MDNESNVDAGSNNSGESVVDTTNTEKSDTVADTTNAGDAVEQKAGDACTCPDGRPGTLHDQDGTLVCLANQG
jgi:hypothetical protein